MNPVAQALATLVPQVQKLAAEAKRRATVAPKATDPAAVEKVAAALVDSGWVGAARKAEAVAALSTHNGALDTLSNLAVKSAEELGRKQDPRLAAGTPVGTETAKQASEPYESEADRRFLERMTSFQVRKKN